MTVSVPALNSNRVKSVISSMVRRRGSPESSVISAATNPEIRSSAGCPIRRSTRPARYSLSRMRASNDTSLIMPTPGSMWNVSSMLRRCSSRSSSGTPTRRAMTIEGSCAAKSWT